MCYKGTVWLWVFGELIDFLLFIWHLKADLPQLLEEAGSI